MILFQVEGIAEKERTKIYYRDLHVAETSRKAVNKARKCMKEKGYNRFTGKAQPIEEVEGFAISVQLN